MPTASSAGARRRAPDTADERGRASIAPPACPMGRAARRFQHVGELALVLGIPEFLVERALPYLTVYSGQPQINILTPRRRCSRRCPA